MNKRILPLLALSLGVCVLTNAQEKEKTEKLEKIKAEKEYTIRKKDGSKEKMTIVIDDNEITVNGKPLNDLKDIEVLRKKGMDMADLKGMLAPLGKLRMEGNFTGNSAYLGVTSNASDKGAKIVSVQKESPAEKAGFKTDDIITKVNDTKISSSSDLYDAIGEFKPEQKVTITYLRGDKENTATVTLEKNANSEAKVFNFKDGDFNFDMPEIRNLPRINGMDLSNFSRKPRLGLEIQDLEDGKGVKILDVDDDTPASKAGLKKDDVISEINGKSISSVDDLQSTMKGIKEGDSFKVTFTRAGQTQNAEIKFPKKLKTAEL